MEVTLTVKHNKLAKLANLFGGWVDKELEASIHRLQSFAIQEAPRASGRLAQAHRIEKVGNGWRLIVRDVPYWPFVYYGTKPHIIRPKRAKVLHWDNVFAAYVRHPGTKPNKWMDRALAREEGHFKGAISHLAQYIETV